MSKPDRLAVFIEVVVQNQAKLTAPRGAKNNALASEGWDVERTREWAPPERRRSESGFAHARRSCVFSDLNAKRGPECPAPVSVSELTSFQRHDCLVENDELRVT